MTEPQPDVAAAERSPERYERRARRYERLLAATRRRISWIAGARLAAFLLTAFFVYASLVEDPPVWPWLVGALLSGAGFAVAVALHRRPYALAPRLEALVAVNREGAARLRGEWAALRDDGADFLDPADPLRGELQLFGRGSAWQVVSRASLPGARARLARLLRDGVPAADLPARQAASAELAERSGLRQRLEAEARLARMDEAAMGRFLRWAEEGEAPRWLPAAVWAARGLVPATWVQLVLTLGFEVPTAWPFFAVAQVALFLVTTRPLARRYEALVVDEAFRPFVGLRRMCALVERPRLRAPLLVALQRRLVSGGVPASARMAELESVVGLLAVRLNAIMYGVFNLMALVEIHGVGRLERWRARHGRHVRTDLEVLADLEVLGSVGAFAWDRPGYAWPTVRDAGEPFLDAEGLGHPLFPVERRRVNDFRMASGGTLALVTGSNMAGKSSFLRTLGLNVLLARAGAPVCARRFDVRACEPVTSVQVTDAPGEGLSRFYAEVKRIRQVLDAVEAAERDPSRPPCLYLIDEMLSGTNSRERNQASRAIVRRLVAARRSAGLVTTHDLELVRVEHENPEHVRTYHFSDRFDGQALHFDYRLRDGVATTTNALHVLRMEGIDVPAEAGSA